VALRGVRPGPLLVVHGLGDRAAAWRRFAAAMPAGRDIVTFDLPGHGESPPANDSRYPALVEAVGRAAAGYDRFALLGHSVGGALAWLYAASHPERVTRLVLVEPAAPHRSRFLAGPTPPASSLHLRRRREGDWPALLGGVGTDPGPDAGGARRRRHDRRRPARGGRGGDPRREVAHP